MAVREAAGAALPIRLVEKPWGREALPAPFVAPPGQRIGEIWFEPPAAWPHLLAKYIFTSDKLSVQVHPNDAQARAAGLDSRGKEECWLVLDAEPGATLGIGFHEEVDSETLRAAAIDGRIEQMMVWHPVKAGDFFYIPAGTVHAIGAGVSVVELQQNSDITYRLFDYGRPRELHLDAGLAVSLGQPYTDPRQGWRDPDVAATLVEGPLFRLDRVVGAASDDVLARYGTGPVLVLPLAGDVRVDGENVAPGGCAVASQLARVDFAAQGNALIAQPILG